MAKAIPLLVKLSLVIAAKKIMATTHTFLPLNREFWRVIIWHSLEFELEVHNSYTYCMLLGMNNNGMQEMDAIIKSINRSLRSVIIGKLSVWCSLLYVFFLKKVL